MTFSLDHKKFFKSFLHVSRFFPIWILVVLRYYNWETPRKKLKKHSVTKNCSDLSLFEQIILVILKLLQILGLQPQISKKISRSLEQFLLTEGQNNFGNKIPIWFFYFRCSLCYWYHQWSPWYCWKNQRKTGYGNGTCLLNHKK